MSNNVVPISLDAYNESFSRRKRLWVAAGMKCHWCGKDTKLAEGFSWDRATIDHVIPRYKGGSDKDKNLVSACALCNNRRNHEDMCGLPEGSLLGKYVIGADGKPVTRTKNIAPPKASAVPIVTNDKKPAVKFSAEQVLREQRDQALKKIAGLNNEVSFWKVKAERWESMTIMQFIRHRLSISLAVKGIDNK